MTGTQYRGRTMLHRLRPPSRMTILIGSLLVLGACDSTELTRPGGTSVDMVPSVDLAVEFTDVGSEPFGTFEGIDYVRHTGFFEGETSLGTFAMPFEIVAPVNSDEGNGIVLVEPPHNAFGTIGRDAVLGHELLFGAGFSYAAVGWADDGLNVLDPTVPGLLLGGVPVEDPGAPNPAPTLDEEILIQFAEALVAEPFGQKVLGEIDRRYAYGVSQTAAGLMELRRNLAATSGTDLFDLTLMHIAVWNAPFEPPGAWDFLDGAFEPVDIGGRVLFVESENDQIVSEAEQFGRAVGAPGYRVYEVAGAAHLPTPFNALDHVAVARALFVAGDAWVRRGTPPPPSALLESAPTGEIDPVYGFETGIARDENLNALSGVRLPDLAVGRAQFIAADPATPAPGLPPPFAVLSGSTVDLACEPAPGSFGDRPRFRSHGDYVSRFVRQVNELRREGFLLPADAEAMKERASESEVGKPGSCAG